MFAKSKRKGLTSKLHKELLKFHKEPSPKILKNILPLITDINDSMIQEKFQSENLTEHVNAKIYSDDTVDLLIQSMPFFDQLTLNALSTLLQTTIREFQENSLPKYLIEHQDNLEKLLSYFDIPLVANTAHILIRTSIKSRDFAQFLFEKGYVGSFIQFLSGDNFDKLSTAFATYDSLLNSHIDVSVEYISNNWEIFQIQFKQLLSSPNYLVQLNFLPILYKFLTTQQCKMIFLKYLDDIESLQLLMMLLKSQSKKVATRAYSLFILFVLNPRRHPNIASALKKNRVKLCKLLNDFQLEDNSQESEDERQQVISIINHLK